MSRLTHLGVAVAAGAILLQAAPASAQQTDPQGGGGIFGWSVAASLQLRVAPDYMGSKTYRVGPGGSLSLSRPGAAPVFGAPDDSPSLHLTGDRSLNAGLVARWRSSRDDHGALRGFDKIDWSVEPGAFVNWWPVDGLRVRAEVRHGFGGNRSWMADLGADAVYQDPSWVLSIGPRAHWAESRFTRTYFGVTPLEAARSPFGIGAYAGDGTFSSAGLLASAEYHWTSRWSIVADSEYHRLMGTAAGSPIVANLGSKDQFSAAIGAKYAFGR
jgi:outer membrane protein